MGMYYDIGRTLSYNALWHFVVGMRGVGKTYGFKDWAIRDFKRNTAQFVYIRRFESELDGGKFEKFFDDIRDKYPDDKLEIEGYDALINRKIIGKAIPLTKAQVYKSVSFPMVNKGCFDEFIIDTGAHYYLPDEPTKMSEMYQTISRDRDIRLFFMSNAISFYNPYFVKYDLRLPYGKNVIVKNDMLLELVESPAFVEHMNNSRFGKMIRAADEAYAEYSINNQFLRDNDNFIQKKTEKSEYYFTFTYLDKTYGVWLDARECLMFVSYDYDPTYRVVYSLTFRDHTANTVLLKNLNGSPKMKVLVERFRAGRLRFENAAIKAVVADIMKLTV